MPRTRGFRLGFLALMLACCAATPIKAQEHVLPSDYYPAIPGTWWTYKVTTEPYTGGPGVEKEDTVRVLPQYCLQKYSHGGHSLCDHSYRFVPMVGNLDLCTESASPVYGSNFLSFSPAGCGVLYDYILDREDSTWTYPDGGDTRCGLSCATRTVVSADTSLALSGVLHDSLVLIRDSSLFYGTMRNEFYRKGVGLVYQEQWPIGGSIRSIRELVDYKISTDTRLGQIIVLEAATGMTTGSLPIAGWGNNWSFKLPHFPSDWPLEVQMGGPKDTLRFEAHATSGLHIDISVIGDTLLGSDWFIPKNRWYGVRVEMNQSGNESFRPAPAFKGIVCISPKLIVEADTAQHLLRVAGFPDSLVYWTWSATNASPQDPAGSGLTLAPSKNGYYRAEIRDSAFTDSLCGPSRFLYSEPVHVETVTPVLARQGHAAFFSLRLAGRTIATGLPVVESGLHFRLVDVKGQAVPGFKLVRSGDVLDAAPQAPLRAGIYFYSLEAGQARKQGRILLSDLP